MKTAAILPFLCVLAAAAPTLNVSSFHTRIIGSRDMELKNR